MQVEINVDDAYGPNPKFDAGQRVHPVTNWPELHIPRGTIIDHPDAYMLCQGPQPRAIPHDDEAKSIHAKYLQRREAGLAERAAQQQAGEQGDAEPDGDEAPVGPKKAVRSRGKREADLTE